MTAKSNETGKGEAIAKVTIEIIPTNKDSKVEKFNRVMEFSVAYEDLPI